MSRLSGFRDNETGVQIVTPSPSLGRRSAGQPDLTRRGPSAAASQPTLQGQSALDLARALSGCAHCDGCVALADWLFALCRTVLRGFV